MLIEKCPHCNTSHVQTEDLYRSTFNLRLPILVHWVMVRCQNPKCERLILVIKDSQAVIKSIYPPGSFELDNTVTIDNEIRNDFREAGLCLSVGCFKASIVMSRRVLQRCLKEQGYNEYKLSDAIDNAMKGGTLRKPFHDIATEIRQYGNIGAHPDDDQLSNIDKAKATDILSFARLLIEEFYEIPAAAEKLRKDRQSLPPAAP